MASMQIYFNEKALLFFRPAIIAGSVVGGFIFLVLLTICIVCICCASKCKKESQRSRSIQPIQTVGGNMQQFQTTNTTPVYCKLIKKKMCRKLKKKKDEKGR